MAEKYRILSFDGGGIRGLISAVWLAELEERLGGKILDRVDLLAGTSTGSIIACAVAAGFSGSDLVKLYQQHGSTIFPAAGSRLWSRATRVFSEGVSAPKYDGKGLEAVLQQQFKSIRLGDLAKRVLVFSYDTLSREGTVFKNTHARHKDVPVWQVVKASCSAPTYFPATELEIQGATLPMIDGGVVANNPTACAIAEAVRVNRGVPDPCSIENFIVGSLGTGQLTRPISVKQAREWGAIEWAIPVIDVIFDGTADATDYIVRQIVPEDRYVRLQTELSDAYDDMDNATRTNLNALVTVAGSYARSPQGTAAIDKLVKLLG